MDIVNSLAAAEKSFADGAQLVVYNLTATVMAHLAELRTATSK
jgi:4-hydroxy-2-oxoheptanedioate aldolase